MFTLFDMTLCELLATLTGSIGAVLIAMNISSSRYGFILFLLSNLFWLYYAFDSGIDGLAIQQVVFMVINGLGIYRWFFNTQTINRGTHEYKSANNSPLLALWSRR